MFSDVSVTSQATAVSAVTGQRTGSAAIGNRWSDAWQGLQTQCRVIKALVLRETLSRYGQHKLGFLWALVEPIGMVMIFASIMGAFRTGDPSGIPLVLFMITGFVPFMMFRDPMTQMQGAIVSNRSLIGFPQVTTFDVIVARSVLECAVLAVVLPVMLVLADVLLGYSVQIENLLGVLAACLLLMTMGSGLGFLFAALAPVWPSSRQLSSVVLGRPLFFSSGLFFTAESLPPGLREWLLWNPLLHMIELLRSEFFYGFDSPYADWNYASLWAAGTLAFGMLVHQALRRRAIVGL